MEALDHLLELCLGEVFVPVPPLLEDLDLELRLVDVPLVLVALGVLVSLVVLPLVPNLPLHQRRRLFFQPATPTPRTCTGSGARRVHTKVRRYKKYNASGRKKRREREHWTAGIDSEGRVHGVLVSRRPWRR